MEIPEKCKPCIHRINDYCRGHGAKIEILKVDKCNRKKVLTWKEKRKIKHDGVITRKRCE
jgi:hypothetical protein